MPYRLDIGGAGPGALERLIDLGALDVEAGPGDRVAALMPEGVTPAQVEAALGTGDLAVSHAIGRDSWGRRIDRRSGSP